MRTLNIFFSKLTKIIQKVQISSNMHLICSICICTVVYVISFRDFWLQYRNIQDGDGNRQESIISLKFARNTGHFHF